MPHPPVVLSPSTRVRRTPFTPRVEAAGVTAYTVYNHTLLPVVMRSLEEDYWHLRQHVQLWDVTCQRQVEVRGPDAAELVQLLTPRHLWDAEPGRCLYAPLVDAHGAMVNDPVILRLAEDRFWLSIADADVGLWVAGLAQGRGAAVEVGHPPVAVLAVQGPDAERLVARVLGPAVGEVGFFRFVWLPFGDHRVLVARTGWSRQGGFELYLEHHEPCLPLWDALWEAGQDLDVRAGCPNLIERIEGGLLSWGADMTEGHDPFECGLDRFVDLDGSHEFLGRTALERIAERGPARRVVGIEIDADALPPCVEPWPVTVDDERVGRVSSAAWSPGRSHGVAIATVARDHVEPGDQVSVTSPDGVLGGVVRDLPFPQA